MSYCISTIIAIRAPLNVNLREWRTKIKELAQEDQCIWHLNPHNYLSKELHGNKGSYMVIAGVFNYWRPEDSFDFACKLSEEYETEVIIISRDDEFSGVHVGIFDDGRQVLSLKGKVNE